MTWVRTPIALFVLAAAAIGAAATAGMAMRASLHESDQVATRMALELGETQRLRAMRERISRKSRTFLMVGEERFLGELRQAEGAFSELVEALARNAGTEVQRDILAQIAAREDARRTATEKVINARKEGADARALGHMLESDVQPVLDELDGLIARLIEHHQSQVGRARANAADAASLAGAWLWAAAGVALAAAALTSLVLAGSLRRMEGRAAQTRRHLSAIVETSADAVYSCDAQGRVVSWNQSAERLFGYPRDEIIGRHVSILAPPGLDDNLPAMIQRMAAGQRMPFVDTQRRARDGRLIDVVLTLSAITDEAGAVTGLSIIARDVSDQRRLRRDRDRFFELSLDMLCVAGTDGLFKQVSPAFEATLGYTRAELLEQPFVNFVHEDDRPATLKELERMSQGALSLDFENRYRCRNGEYKWLSWRAVPEAGGLVYAMARDVTQRKADQQKLTAMTEELRVMAIKDELTGLHNRRGFNLLAEQQLKRTARDGRKAVFFFADLDGLKQINDKQGHAAGDGAIRDAATLLTAAFRKSDIIARLGGDEFVVLATDAAEGRAGAMIDRLQDMVRQFNETHQRPYKVSVSMGCTTFDPSNPESLDAIIKHADEEMYEQKARRKATTGTAAPPREGQ